MVAECLLSICEALGSISSTAEEKTKVSDFRAFGVSDFGVRDDQTYRQENTSTEPLPQHKPLRPGDAPM